MLTTLRLVRQAHCKQAQGKQAQGKQAQGKPFDMAQGKPNNLTLWKSDVHKVKYLSSP